MKLNVAEELTALEQMTVGQLQQLYADALGETVRSRHKQYLIRRIAWRLQANAEGGLSERAFRPTTPAPEIQPPLPQAIGSIRPGPALSPKRTTLC